MFLFTAAGIRANLVPIQPTVQWVAYAFWPEVKRSFTNNFNLSSSLNKHDAFSLLTLYFFVIWWTSHWTEIRASRTQWLVKC